MAARRALKSVAPEFTGTTVQDLLQTVPEGQYAATVPITARPLSEWGPRLAIGTFMPGGIDRSLELLRPDMDLELKVAPLRSEDELQRYPARMIAAILAETLSTLHGIDLKVLKPAERRHQVHMLSFADVSVLCLLRAVSRRTFRRVMVPLTARQCQSCQKPVAEFQIDADGIVIPTWDWSAGHPPRAVVHLTDPLVVGKLRTKKLVVGPPSWLRSVCDLTADQFEVTAIRDHSIGVASVVAGDDGDEAGPWAAQPARVFRSLSTWDGQALAEATRLVGGQVFALGPYTCPGCGATNFVGLSLQNLDLGFS